MGFLLVRGKHAQHFFQNLTRTICRHEAPNNMIIFGPSTLDASSSQETQSLLIFCEAGLCLLQVLHSGGEMPNVQWYGFNTLEIYRKGNLRNVVCNHVLRASLTKNICSSARKTTVRFVRSGRWTKVLFILYLYSIWMHIWLMSASLQVLYALFRIQCDLITCPSFRSPVHIFLSQKETKTQPTSPTRHNCEVLFSFSLDTGLLRLVTCEGVRKLGWAGVRSTFSISQPQNNIKITKRQWVQDFVDQ